MSAEHNNYYKTNTLYIRSYANVNLGIFLIFFGLIGVVPLYALLMNIVFKQAIIEWRIGIVFAIISIIAGYCLIRFSRRRFSVHANSDGSGQIDSHEGLFNKTLHYSYNAGAKIKLSIANTDKGSSHEGIMQTTLIDGNHHFLLDSRRYGKLQEARAIAEFLAKNGGLKLFIPHYGNLELDSADLDLSFAERVKKYPTLIGLEPNRPQGCPIKITDLNNGTDRRYSWGYRANGLIGQLFAMLMICLVISCLPMFKEEESYCSLLSYATAVEDYTYFYIVGGIVAFVSLFLMGFGLTITAEGFRINVHYTVWGVIYRHRSILIDRLEEITTKETASGSIVQLISDENSVKVRVANSILANYLASDLRHFIANKS